MNWLFMQQQPKFNEEFLVVILSLSLLVAKSYGSLGDSTAIFHHCTYNCVRDLECPRDMNVLQWNLEPCFSCRQECIWATVDVFKRTEKGEKIPQFFGKWPFISISLPLLSFIPIQEPASMVFSLLNLYTTILFYNGVCRLRRSTLMKSIWKTYAFIGIFAWVSSAVFHWSDFWLTEYLDYFSAFCLILFAFYASVSLVLSAFYDLWIVRLSHKGLFVALSISYVFHVQSMIVHFDYGYNMICCILYSCATVIVYCLWISYQWIRRSKTHRTSLLYLGTAMVVIIGSGLMETVDYPPFLWVFDPHSLFHLATVPFPLLMLKFVLLENEYSLWEFGSYSKLA